MKKAISHRAAFSLIEVSAALCIISVAMVSLLALVPMGLANTRACKSETHAAELAQSIFTTLATEPFQKAPCYSTDAAPLDLATLKNLDPRTSQPTILYASYDVRREYPLIVRADTLPGEMQNDGEIYRIELRNQPQTFSSVDSAVVGSQLKVAVYLGKEQTAMFKAASFLGNYSRAGLLPQTVLNQ